jgi:8-oxo-dGTP pyrophosphatase MutT (NUDIX family)
VIAAGEEPRAASLRELCEELGIVGVTLADIGTHLYEDDTVRCFEHAYEVVWDGPIRHQPEEVAEGRWVASAELATMLADPALPFVPDSRQLLERLAARGVSDYDDLTSG